MSDVSQNGKNSETSFMKEIINKKIKRSLNLTISEGEPRELYQYYIEKLSPVEKKVLRFYIEEDKVELTCFLF